MAKFLYQLRLHYILNHSKSLKSSNRSLYNSRSCFDEKKDDEKSTGETAPQRNVQNGHEGDKEDALKETQTLNVSAADAQSPLAESKAPGGEASQSDAERKKEAQKKLKELLRVMTKIDPAENLPKVELPRPRVEAQKKYRTLKTEYLERKERMERARIGSQLEKAASKVAEKLGGDTKRTERELLDLYLGRSSEKVDSKTVEQSGEFKGNDEKKPEMNMKNLLRSLKIEKTTPDEVSRAHQVRVYKWPNKTVVAPRVPLSRARAENIVKTDLFGAEPLGIFTEDEEGKKGPPAESVMWDFLQERDLRLSVTHPPANIFEQLIQWTEQGKIWKFPINNEQDWEEENVDFTEHVFLEHMLEPWCPSSGLIRHFMELVCVGLSKNPYMTVQEKHAHIIFYEHYFRQKNSLLVDLGLEPIKDRPQLEERQEVAV